jgi:hypothetical protein
MGTPGTEDLSKIGTPTIAGMSAIAGTPQKQSTVQRLKEQQQQSKQKEHHGQSCNISMGTLAAAGMNS